MTLYEIDQEIENCESVDEETGEIYVDLGKLEALQLERDKKIENVALWVKDLEAEKDAIVHERQALAKREQTAEHKIDDLKKWLAFALDGQKFETARVAVSYRKSTSVVVKDVYKLPEEYIRYLEPEVKKTELKKAMQLGFEFPEAGAELIEKKNMQIR